MADMVRCKDGLVYGTAMKMNGANMGHNTEVILTNTNRARVIQTVPQVSTYDRKLQRFGTYMHL
jgi:hypothetical protein